LIKISLLFIQNIVKVSVKCDTFIFITAEAEVGEKTTALHTRAC